MTPKVSVMIPSYNHEPYVAEAVESVLNQTFTDFELLISDDASPDRSAEILQRYDDPRIDLHLSSENQGATLNLQYLVDKCRGEYVALNNSDDVWLPQRLEKGVAYLDAHPECGAVFSQAALIDENSHVLTADCEIFHQPNRTRAEWYRHFFTKANCLCHPSVLIRRSVYEQIGCYTMGMRQLPDFWMWVRLVKHFELHVLPEVLVQHRRCVTTLQNTSAPVPDNSVRDINESLYILLHYFDDVDDAFFKEAFQKFFRDKNAQTHEELICERFFLILDNHYYMPKINRLAAMYFFLQHCDTPELIHLLMDRYHYSLNDFYKVGSEMDLTRLREKAPAATPESDPILAHTSWFKRAFSDTPLYGAARKVYHKLRND